MRSRPRTSLGDGVVKPGSRRIEWVQLLRRVYWVDASVTMITIPREGINMRPQIVVKRTSVERILRGRQVEREATGHIYRSRHVVCMTGGY